MIIGILNQKGGVGKTSLATNLAFHYSQGSRVLLVDADPQGSSLAWSSARQAPDFHFPVIGMPKPTLHKDLPAVARNYDITIIDGPGRNSDLTRAAVIASDLIVIPVTPSPYDIWASAEVVNLYHEARTFKESLKAVFVLNRKISNTAIGRDVLKTLEQFEIPTLGTHLVQRVVYPESANLGLAVEEYEPHSPAVLELARLGDEIFRAGDDYEILMNTLSQTMAGAAHE